MKTTSIRLKNLLAKEKDKFLEIIQAPHFMRSIVKDRDKLIKLHLYLNNHIAKAERAAAKTNHKRAGEKLMLWYYLIEFMALKEQVGAYLYALTDNKTYITTTVGSEMAAKISRQWEQ